MNDIDARLDSCMDLHLSRRHAHHHVISVETPRKAFVYDTDGKQGVTSRLKASETLRVLRIPLIAYHFLWPGIGHVDRYGDGFRYFPTPMRTTL